MRWLLSSLFLSSIPSLPSAQTSWYVDGPGCSGTGDGGAGNPFCTIQQAVDAAASGDTVLVRPGVYLENVSVRGIRIALIGEHGADQTWLEGSGEAAITLAPGGDLQLEGLCLSGAGLSCKEAQVDVHRCRFVDTVQFMGGGIWAERSEVSVTESSFEDTVACLGGAIAAVGGTIRVEDCGFIGDRSLYPDAIAGGALWLEDEDSAVSNCSFRRLAVRSSASAIWVRRGRIALEHSDFSDNYVFDYSGTVSITEAEARIRNCTFRDNRSSVGWGGAVFVRADPVFEVEISQCAFARNSAAEGGAVAVFEGLVTLDRCTFSQNVAGAYAYLELGYGGGVLVGGSGGTNAFARISRCEFIENSAYGLAYQNDGQGGGVFGPAELVNCTFFRNRVGGFFGNGPTGGAVSGGASLQNCIVWENKPDQLEASSSALWSNVMGGWPGEGNFDADPRFWDREHGDVYLLPSSPCIDHGDPTQSDPDGSRLDVGAHFFDSRHGSLGRKGSSPERVNARGPSAW